MSRLTVCAVMKVTIEVPVRSSNAGETFHQMYEAARREAEDVLRSRLPSDSLRIAGPIEFSHAIVKEWDK